MRYKSNIIVIFDFCETLVDFQTADAFADYIFKKKPYSFYLIVEIFRLLLLKFNLLPGNSNKILSLLKLRGFCHNYVAKNALFFYNEKIESFLIKKNIDKLLWHKSQGHYIVLVSGGYLQYLKIFAEKYEVDMVIGTEMSIKNGKLTGYIEGKDCVGFNKLYKLLNAVDLSFFDLDESYCYTDSISDLPILTLVGNRYIYNSNIDKEILSAYKLISF